MTLSYRAAPVAWYNGRDQVRFRSHGFPTPYPDPGLGGGGSETITVRQDGTYKLAWSFTPPAGYPANPTLVGGERFWLHGFHNYGRISFSPRFGIIVCGIVGLRSNGTIGHANYAFLPDESGTSSENLDWPRSGEAISTWKYIAPFLGDGGENTASSWSYHLGFDHALQSDLVYNKNDRSIRRISGSWPNQATLGAEIWRQTAAHLTAGYNLNFSEVSSGYDRISLPWRNEWWIVQLTDDVATVNTNKIWGFNYTQAGDSSAFEVTIPTSIRSLFGTANTTANLCLSVDQTSRRVIAASPDSSATPVVENSLNKYPLRLWEIDPATRQWTDINITNPPNVCLIGKAPGSNLLTWSGGFQWIYWDIYGGGQNYIWQTPNALGRSTGGYKPKIIKIPRASQSRTITFTARDCGNFPYSSWTRQKHTEYAYRTTNGRVYSHGGDWSGAPSADMMADGSQAIYSFNPENPSGTMVEEQDPVFANRAIRPVHPDENGWIYRIPTDEFWMMYGYPYPTTTDSTHTGYVQGESIDRTVNPTGDWLTATGGGSEVFWRWNPNTKVWTTFPVIPASGETAPFGNETLANNHTITGSHQLRWYYDPAADRIVVPAFGGNVTYQAPCVKFIEFTTGSPRYRVFKANNGPTITPDGRPTNSNPLWNEDRAAFDSTNGYLYTLYPATGDVFRIQTWTAPGNYTYPVVGGGGDPSLPVSYCCKVPPTVGSKNQFHMHAINGVLWIIWISASGRTRVFSWAPGETFAWEHTEIPNDLTTTNTCKYGAAGSEKLMLIPGTYAYSQPAFASSWNKVWTGVIT